MIVICKNGTMEPVLELGGDTLCGVDLSKADLRDANLSGKRLVGAYLQHADLSGANLIGANLDGAEVGGAKFCDADLRDTVLPAGVASSPPDFDGARLADDLQIRSMCSYRLVSRLDAAIIAIDGSPWIRWHKAYGISICRPVAAGVTYEQVFGAKLPTTEQQYRREHRDRAFNFLRDTAIAMADAERAKPRYKHDCPDCVFLGQRHGHDLYFCPRGHRPLVLARYGDESGARITGLATDDTSPDYTLNEARRLAAEAALYCAAPE